MTKHNNRKHILGGLKKSTQYFSKCSLGQIPQCKSFKRRTQYNMPHETIPTAQSLNLDSLQN